ncbi:choice-of-anchor Q domain-containing protein [Chondrinema litorale]|uniref:choice-of-anchor Q domain-containing protein n=1 Tax=Chondrinema litorale TaxID=2994555 RepID=UPI002542B7BD|nr:choice-of-anchor Q domain-containing protein [Chondrinema litorale]UZR97912.1 hypothetical protein OQ292_29290 [Chondrinema litorale]
MKFLHLFLILIFTITSCDVLNIEKEIEKHNNQSNENEKKFGDFMERPTDIFVNTTGQDDHVFDICDGKGDCNLVDAIETANLRGGTTTIHLQKGKNYYLSEAAYFTKKEKPDGTYQLVLSHSVKDSGLPVIKSTIIIEGNGATLKRRVTRTQVFDKPDSNQIFRIIHNSNSGDLTLKNVTLSEGIIDTKENFSETQNGNGGAIYNAGKLTLENVTIKNNQASKNGGAIFSIGPVSISNSDINQNNALNDGGGLFILGFDNIEIDNSSFTHNTSSGKGGGIFCDAELTLTSSNLSFNNSEQGGGIYLGHDKILYNIFNKLTYSPAFIDQCIIESNETSKAGGGIFCEITEPDETMMGYPSSSSLLNLTIHRSTITNNIATRGGGIMNWFATMYLKDITILNNEAHQDYDSGAGGGMHFEFGFAHMENTVIAKNPVGGDLGGLTVNIGYISESVNFVGDQTFTGPDIIHGNPMIKTLSVSRDTKVYIPMPGSPLIDAGTAMSCLATDQRDLPRPVGSACDLGAVEVQ